MAMATAFALLPVLLWVANSLERIAKALERRDDRHE